MTAALIVIDMQQGSFTAATPRHDTEGLVRRLNGLGAAVGQSGGLVVFVQHDGPQGDPHHPDRPGWRLLPSLHVGEAASFVRKRSCDAFLDTGLEAVLQAHAIRRLVITGCATDYCVDTTVRSALARGYATTVPSDGHTTADRPHLPAIKIIEHHNAIWSDFIAPAGPAWVRPCSELTF